MLILCWQSDSKLHKKSFEIQLDSKSRHSEYKSDAFIPPKEVDKIHMVCILPHVQCIPDIARKNE